MSTDAIIPVGKNCDCGHPLIWRNGRQICAVYGRHPADEEVATFGPPGARIIYYRNRNAFASRLIDDLSTGSPQPRTRTIAV